MLRRILTLPLVVILIGIGAIAMFLPAAHAVALRDWHTARAFVYSGSIFLILAGFLALATSPYRPSRLARSRLIALLAAYAALPLMLAVPFHEALPSTTYLKSYFEMVSSLTTTGATVYTDPARLPDSLHLWRALVGWMGGFFMWVIAVSVFQPLNLGGFEVLSGAASGSDGAMNQITRVADPAERMARFSASLFPVYLSMTLILWIGLILTGDSGLVAICHAMSTLSTSGISPINGGVAAAGSGRSGEVLILLFLAFALSRRTFAGADQGGGLGQTWRDPEFRLGLLIIAVVPAMLFLRHWIGAYEVRDESNLGAALGALWGSVFSVASFLTTTGFVSADWLSARSWSGLPTPGLILMGLAVFGGGVATTAGGVKLLRVYALWKHGVRELEKLVEPHSVGGSGKVARHLRRQGAYIAWVFFMLFAISIAVVMLALSLDGLSLNDSITFAIAALSTTGPVANVAGSVPLSYDSLSDSARMILAASMVLGRVETLAIIALLNPEFWRR
ncbi:TrkH family potassium uptake protein [Frigidibacter sp. ROC022]|uniref:TrkH family potassium uptake protein n=1 Tax=Frigidibacter sp. ROC022 TaxID=2971796 RepID=UPI00215AFD94|nr:potassium transporter TrkG [Frigidibacter sp. ROC022]MCR8723451.1 TrkH family potassium uptake protein [Frigidibacter sp. ROC022]